MADIAARGPITISAGGRSSLHKLMQRKSTIAFLMTLPLILLILVLVAYPAGYAVYLAMLNKGMTRFVGLGNFAFLFGRDTFWMVVFQSCLFAITAVIFKAIIGFVVAHFVHNIPSKGQRKWRGMLLVPWVIPPAMSTLAWLWLFDPSYSAFNWILEHIGLDHVAWLGETGWARFSVILVNVWIGAPFFMIMYLASRGGGDRRRHLVAAHLVRDPADDAQHHRHHRAVLPDRHLRQLRHRARLDQGRSAQHDPRVRHLGVPRRHRERRYPVGRQRLAVHGADPGGGRNLHPARHHQAGE